MAGISRTEIEHLAQLARMDLSPAELDAMAGQLEVIVASVARVAEVAAVQVPATSHSIVLTNVLREDVTGACLSRDEVLAAAPAAEAGRFRVPRILDET